MNKAVGYRKLMGMTQREMASVFGISVQALRLKEKGVTQYKDAEKIIFRDMLRGFMFPNITVDEIFFD